MPNLQAQLLAKINEEMNLQFVMKYFCLICTCIADPASGCPGRLSRLKPKSNQPWTDTHFMCSLKSCLEIKFIVAMITNKNLSI